MAILRLLQTARHSFSARPPVRMAAAFVIFRFALLSQLFLSVAPPPLRQGWPPPARPKAACQPSTRSTWRVGGGRRRRPRKSARNSWEAGTVLKNRLPEQSLAGWVQSGGQHKATACGGQPARPQPLPAAPCHPRAKVDSPSSCNSGRGHNFLHWPASKRRHKLTFLEQLDQVNQDELLGCDCCRCGRCGGCFGPRCRRCCYCCGLGRCQWRCRGCGGCGCCYAAAAATAAPVEAIRRCGSFAGAGAPEVATTTPCSAGPQEVTRAIVGLNSGTTLHGLGSEGEPRAGWNRERDGY